MRNFIQENFYILTASMLAVVFISNDAFLPAIPAMALDFASSEARLQQGVSAFVLGSLMLQVFVGPLSDRYGRRPIMITGAWMFLIGSIACISAQNINMFLLARILQGSAMASTQISAMAAINEFYDRNKAMTALALSVNISLLSPMLGPIFGAFVLDMPAPKLFHAFSSWAWGSWQAWRFIFIYIGILGLCATSSLMAFMPEPTKLNSKIPPKKTPTPNSQTQDSQKSLFYIFKQLPLLLSNPLIALYSISAAMGGFSLLLWLTSAPVMLMTNLGLSERTYAWIQTPVFIAMFLGNSIAPLLTRQLGSMRYMNMMHVAFLIASPIIFLIPYLWQNSPLALVLAFSLFSFCLGTINAVKNQFIISLSQFKGSVTSVAMLINTLGVLSGTLVASLMGKFPNYWSFAIISLAALLLGSLALGANLFLPKHKHSLPNPS